MPSKPESYSLLQWLFDTGSCIEQSILRRFSVVRRIFEAPFDYDSDISLKLPAIEEFTSAVNRLGISVQVSIFGWHDYAVFHEIHSGTIDTNNLREALDPVATYRPEEGGPICVWISAVDSTSSILCHFDSDSGALDIYGLEHDA